MDTGEFPGYEFEVPRGPRQGPRRDTGHDSLHQLRYAPQHAQVPRSPVRTASSGVFDVMRGRNWLMGLAAPIMAAIAVGIAVVVVAGGSGGAGAAPSALAAGFPPARAAGPEFTGTGGTVAGGALRGRRVGRHRGGGGRRGRRSGPVGLHRRRERLEPGGAGRAGVAHPAGTGQLAAVAARPAGWLAVGTDAGRSGRPAAGLPRRTRGGGR